MLSKNHQFRAIFCVFLIIYASTSSAKAADFKSEQQRFSLRYPDNFEPVLVSQPGVVLALKVKGHSFPTFNIIYQVGNYAFSERSAEEKSAEIMNSYKLVGITDAKLISTDEQAIEDIPIFNVELRYTLQGENLCSNVSIVPGLNRHFIMTFIDDCSSYANSKAQAAEIRKSYRPLDPIGFATKEPEGSLSKIITLVILSCGVVALVVFTLIWKRRRKI